MLRIFATLMVAGLALNLAPLVLKDTPVGGGNFVPASLRNNFYFGKGQWLADARTLVAAVHFLRQTMTSADANHIAAAGRFSAPSTNVTARLRVVVTDAPG